MSADPSKLVAARNAPLPDGLGSTSITNGMRRYWNQLKAPLLVQEASAVSHVHFNPSAPHDLAFTSSTRIQILDADTQQVRRTFARFKNTVYSGEFRFDGKLLCAGDGGGLVQCFDTTSRAVLVTLQASRRAVRVTKFHPSSKSTLLSAGDDQTVRLWDLTSPDPVVEFADMHNDYIRAASFVGNNLLATGCYDGYVRLFDSRAPKPVLEFDLQQPVESVCSLDMSESTSTSLAAASGNEVRIFDLVSGRQISSIGNFQKTVTCVNSISANVSSNSRQNAPCLLAGSLDGHVKLFSTENLQFETVFGWKYGGPVLSTAMSPNEKQLATGLTTGLLSVRTRKDSAEKQKTTPKQQRTLNQQRLMRGSEYKGEHEMQVLEVMQKSKSKPKLCEKLIKAFRWSDALDAALRVGVSPDQTRAVLEDLRSRGKVQISLYDRDVAGLEPLLRWCVKRLSDARYVDTASDWISAVIDVHQETIEDSPVLAALVSSVLVNLREQTARAREAQTLEGMIELLIA